MTQESALALLKRPGWSKSVIELVREKQHCEYCPVGEREDARDPKYFWRMTTDHIVPGDGDGFENIALACAKCNSRKRNRLPEGLSADKFRQKYPTREEKVLRIRDWLQEIRSGRHTPSEAQQFEAFGVLWRSAPAEHSGE